MGRSKNIKGVKSQLLISIYNSIPHPNLQATSLQFTVTMPQDLKVRKHTLTLLQVLILIERPLLL